MGDLTKLPLSEIVSTLEMLERKGVRPEDWDGIRRSERAAMIVGVAFRGELEFTPKKPKVLDLLGTTDVPSVTRFDLSNKFKRGRSAFSSANSHFARAFFGRLEGKIEVGVPAAKLVSYRLKTSSTFQDIQDELEGGMRETSIAHICALFERQDGGRPGPLNIHGGRNIFLARDIGGKSWILSVVAGICGWLVDADVITSQERLPAGSTVFSCLTESQE